MNNILENKKKASVSEANIFFKFDTKNLISKSHYFEQIFKFKFSKKKQLIRFNIKAFNKFNLYGCEDIHAAIYFFKLKDCKKKPEISKSIYSLKFLYGVKERTISFFHNFLTDDELCTYIYIDKHQPYSFEITDFEIISSNDHIKVNKLNNNFHIKKKPTSLQKVWYQKNNRIFCEFLGYNFFADMPNNFNLNDVPPDLIKAVNHLLFGNIEKIVFDEPSYLVNKNYLNKREVLDSKYFQNQKKMLLCFSTGEDSTAALLILPENDTYCYYSKRNYNHYYTSLGYLINLGTDCNEEHSLSLIQNIIKIENNFEKIGLFHGLTHGYRDNYGYGALGLLLGYYLNIKIIAFGGVMEQVFLKSGFNFTNIIKYKSSSFNRYRDFFANFGFYFSFPVGFISEVVTSSIVSDINNKYITNACPNKTIYAKDCGYCFKCFRKTLLKKETNVVIDKSLLNIFEKRPLKSATSLIYSINSSGIEVPNALKEYSHLKLCFLKKYYSGEMNSLLPLYFSSYVKKKLKEYKIEPMNIEEEKKLKEIAKIFDPKNYSDKRAL